MPAVSEKQRRAAFAELGRRRKGKAGGKRRPFGTAKTSDIEDFTHTAKKRKKK